MSEAVQLASMLVVLAALVWLARLLDRIASALERLEEKLPLDGYGRLAVTVEKEG